MAKKIISTEYESDIMSQFKWKFTKIEIEDKVTHVLDITDNSNKKSISIPAPVFKEIINTMLNNEKTNPELAIQLFSIAKSISKDLYKVGKATYKSL